MLSGRIRYRHKSGIWWSWWILAAGTGNGLPAGWPGLDGKSGGSGQRLRTIPAQVEMENEPYGEEANVIGYEIQWNLRTRCCLWDDIVWCIVGNAFWRQCWFDIDIWYEIRWHLQKFNFTWYEMYMYSDRHELNQCYFVLSMIPVIPDELMKVWS